MDRTQHRPRHHARWSLVVVALGAAWLSYSLASRPRAPSDVSYSKLLDLLHEGKVASVEIDERRVTARLRSVEQPGPRIRAQRLPGIDERALIEELRDRGIPFAGIKETAWSRALPWAFLSLLIGALWMWLVRPVLSRPSEEARAGAS